MPAELIKFINDNTRRLAEVGIESGRYEIEWMLCHLLGIERLKLYLDGEQLLDDSLKVRFEALMHKRLTRYPLQFILNEAWFYGRKFYVDERVMAPTPETERLCELALKFIGENRLECPEIVDLGVGSGVIAVTMANELEKAKILAVDISGDALEVARKNVENLGGSDKIEFLQSDYFEKMPSGRKFDLILANPPYITDEDYPDLPPEVLADPKVAMVGGEKGLDKIEIIIKQAPDFLFSGGRIMFEIGYDQAETVAEMTQADKRYKSIEIIKDLNDIDRVVILECED